MKTYALTLAATILPLALGPAVGGSEKWGHFGRIKGARCVVTQWTFLEEAKVRGIVVVQIPLAATTFGISTRSGPDDSLFDFSLRL